MSIKNQMVYTTSPSLISCWLVNMVLSSSISFLFSSIKDDNFLIVSYFTDIFSEQVNDHQELDSDQSSPKTDLISHIHKFHNQNGVLLLPAIQSLQGDVKKNNIFHRIYSIEVTNKMPKNNANHYVRIGLYFYYLLLLSVKHFITIMFQYFITCYNILQSTGCPPDIS
jgi:hypothetical protein